MIKLVIFDLDGVITETSKQHFMAWQALAIKLGGELPTTFEEHLKGVSRKESLEKILDFLSINTLSEDEQSALMDEKNKHYQSLIKDISETDIFPGIQALIDYLKSEGIYIAIGSASKNAKTILDGLKITNQFDYIVDPRNCQSKPAPDIFLDAKNHFNLPANACIGIEDAQAGVEAIKAANMVAIAIGKNLEDADYRFNTTEALTPKAMRRILKECDERAN